MSEQRRAATPGESTIPVVDRAQEGRVPEVTERVQPLAAPLLFTAEDESRAGLSSARAVRRTSGAVTPTRTPRSVRKSEHTSVWEEPGIRTPSYLGTPRLHTRTGSSVSANVVEAEPDPEMLAYLEKQAAHSAQVTLELSQQDVMCLEDEEDTGRVMLSSEEAVGRRRLRKLFRQATARLDGCASYATTLSARSSLPPTPPAELLSVGNRQEAAKAAKPAAGDGVEDWPVQREGTVEPHEARRQRDDLGPYTSYGAVGSRDDDRTTDAFARESSPQPHSGTRASVPVLPGVSSVAAVSRGGELGVESIHDGTDRLTRHGHASSPPPAFVAAGAGGQREALQRELYRTSRFFWPLNVAPVYIPDSSDSQCHLCDAHALRGEEDEEDWLYPYVDTHYYCYSLDTELAALREVRLETAVGDAAGQAGREGSADGSGAAKVYPSPMQSASAPSTGTTGRHELSNRERRWRYNRHYQIARLQRLWSTTVMRQYLLFTLSALFFIAVLVQSTMQGCMNIFEASISNGGWSTGTGVFYSSNNRFGRTVLLTATFFCSGALTMWCMATAHVCCATPSGVEDAEGELVERRRHSHDDLFDDTAHTTSSMSNDSGSEASDSADDDGALAGGIHPSALLIMGVVACTAGSVGIYGGARNSSIGLAVFGEAIYGVGFVVALMGLLMLTLAEVGLQAALTVQLNVVAMAWLFTSSAALFVFPLLNRHWLTTAEVMRCGVAATVLAVLFAFCILLLVPGDVVQRARRPYRRLASPRAIFRALANVSLGFLLRVLTFSSVMALLVLLATSATALLVTSPTSVSDSDGAASSSSDATAAAFGRFFPGPSLQPDEVRRWMALMFIVAAFVWILSMIPRVGALCARTWFTGLLVFAMAVFWCGYGFLTPPLPSDQWGDGNIDGDGRGRLSTTAVPKSRRAGSSPSGLAGLVELWLLRQCFHPRVCLCLTGASFAVLGTSLIRAVANAGVTLPVVPLCYHEGNRRYRDHRHHHHSHNAQRRRHASPTAASAATPVDESSSLLSGRGKSSSPPPLSSTGASPAQMPLEDVVKGMARDEPLIHFQRCGGPTAMLVLTVLVALVSTLATAVTLGVTTWWLSQRAAHPVNPSRMGDTNIPVDAHNVVRRCVVVLVVVAAGSEAIELVYAYVRGRWARRTHNEMHHHASHETGE